MPVHLTGVYSAGHQTCGRPYAIWREGGLDGKAELRQLIDVLAHTHAETLTRPDATERKLDDTLARRVIGGLGVSVLVLEQRAGQCPAIADYGYVLEQGRNRLEGPAQALLLDAEVMRLSRCARRVVACKTEDTRP